MNEGRPVKFYTYDQNNSGGYFIINNAVCEYLIIEANNVDEADHIMREITYDYSNYCECCGERWQDFWGEKGTDEPMIDGIPIKLATATWCRKQCYIYRHGATKPQKIVLKEKVS